MGTPPQKPEPRLVALHRERQLARDHLADGYAQGYLDGVEVERRLEAAERATSVAELRSLTEDLVIDPDAPAEPLVRAGEPRAVSVPAPAARSAGALVVAPAELRLSAIFSENRQTGRWTPGRITHVRSLFGSMKLDLREARLAAGVTELQLAVTFGELEITVPPGVAVEVSCGVMFGDVRQDAGGDSDPDDVEAPRLRLTGRVLFGAVRVRHRLPGEGWWGAKKRQMFGGDPRGSGARRRLPARDDEPGDR